jgi:hypothetical protein
MLKKIVILSLLACMASGCIDEEMGDCGTGLRLQFRYTYNKERRDLLSTQVRDVRIYLFDGTTGVLANIIRADKEEIARGWIEADVPAGIYTATAWGGSGDDLMLGGYHDAEMTDAAAHTYIPQARVGITTLGNFRMMLASQTLPAGYTGEVAPATENFDDLFFALATGISVSKGNKLIVDFDFIKNTSTLKVRVTGFEYLSTRAPAPGQPLEVFVTGPNERYGYNNVIGGHSRELRYEPPYAARTASAMDFNIKVQRLDAAYHSLRPVLLHIRRPSSGQDIIAPLDVMDAILRAKDALGNPLWPTQEDIDREDEFPIEVSIAQDLSVSITVNGFEIVVTNPDIGR